MKALELIKILEMHPDAEVFVNDIDYQNEYFIGAGTTELSKNLVRFYNGGIYIHAKFNNLEA